jgi:hypothetical protein
MLWRSVDKVAACSQELVPNTGNRHVACSPIWSTRNALSTRTLTATLHIVQDIIVRLFYDKALVINRKGGQHVQRR